MKSFDRIKRQSCLEDIVRSYTILTKKDSRIMGFCPFKKVDWLSLELHLDRQLFICHDCLRSGDVLTFIAYLHKCSRSEAADFLERRAERGQIHQKTGDAILLTLAALIFLCFLYFLPRTGRYSRPFRPWHAHARRKTSRGRFGGLH